MDGHIDRNVCWFAVASVVTKRRWRPRADTFVSHSQLYELSRGTYNSLSYWFVVCLAPVVTCCLETVLETVIVAAIPRELIGIGFEVVSTPRMKWAKISTAHLICAHSYRTFDASVTRLNERTQENSFACLSLYALFNFIFRILNQLENGIEARQYGNT
jgi:hypothetical protein